MSAPALSDIVDAHDEPYAYALETVFGFRRVRNVWPVLHDGRSVLLCGWRDEFCQAVARHPGLCAVYWTRTWAETDAEAEAARLAHVRRHARSGAIRLLWAGEGDAPLGAAPLPPVWLPVVPTAPRPGRGVAVTADSGLAAVVGALASGFPVAVSRDLAVPPAALDTAPPPGAVERAEILRALLPAEAVSADPISTASLAVCLPRGTWSQAALDALRAGVPVLASPGLAWTAALPEDVYEACVVSPQDSPEMVADMIARLAGDDSLLRHVLVAEVEAVERLRARNVGIARATLESVGFRLDGEGTTAPVAPPVRPRLHLYADTPGWAQDHFVRDLARHAAAWKWRADVANGAVVPRIDNGAVFYSPCCGAADASGAGAKASTGLWSHVSYGGWFTDDPLDPAKLPRSRAHATNLYLHALTGLPYLAAGVDTDLFAPGTGAADRRTRHRRDPRLVVGFTASLQYNAAVKLFYDLWVPATRMAGTDGHMCEARFCARPLPVWDTADARSPAEVAEYLRGVDVYLCTSISEGCSLSVLEAAAAGCVIISTPCGNAPELASAVVGWDAEEIATALIRYEQDRERLYEDGARARELAVRYWSWRARVKAESWRAWLDGGEVPPWRDQVPYVARGGVGPDDFLRLTRQAREAASPALARGDMGRS